MLALLALTELAGLANTLPSPLRIGLGGILQLPFLAPALLGTFVAQILLRPIRNELLATVLAAAVLAYPIYAKAGLEAAAAATAPMCALGGGTIAVLATQALRHRGEQRKRVLDVLLPALILTGFVLLTSPMLFLTAALWPTTYDHHLYLADAAFGRPLSFDVARLARSVPLLPPLCLAVYVALPLALIVVHALRRRQQEPSPDTLVAFVAVTVVGYLGFLVVPVAGPLYAFPDLFPLEPPDPAGLEPVKTVVQPFPRNCMPSLHSAWALLILWNARPLARPLRVTAMLFVAVTLLATVALGFHYVVDLVAAFPLTLAVQAWAARTADAQLRRRAMAAGLGLTAGWIVLVTGGLALLRISPAVPWGLALSVIAASVHLECRLYRAGRERAGASEVARVAATAVAATSLRERAAALVGALSGAAALLWGTAIAKALDFALGTAIYASAGGLALYLCGLALGVWGGGTQAARSGNPLRDLALAHAMGAIWCVCFPLWLPLVGTVHLYAAGGAQADARWLALPRLGIGALVLVPPAALGGLALPLLAAANRTGPAAKTAASVLVPLFLGAAAGALLAAYVLLPAPWRVTAGLYAAAALVAAICGSRGCKAAAAIPHAFGAAALPPHVDALADSRAAGGDASALRRHRLALTAGTSACLGGFAAAAVQAVCAHLFALVAGDTVYSRALVWFAWLFGLATGAEAVRRSGRISLAEGGLRSSAFLGPDPSGAALALALAVALSGAAWTAIPGYFASFHGYVEQYRMTTTFADRELVRLLVCLAMLAPPAVCAGAMLVSCFDGTADASAAGGSAAAPALALLGGAAGAGVAALFCIPTFGSRTTLSAVAVFTALLGALPLAFSASRRQRGGALLAAALTGVVAFVHPLDTARLASGSGVHFAPTDYGPPADHAESFGAFVSVHRSSPEAGNRLLVNGRLLGESRDLPSRASHALAALLHTDGRERALVTGCGTGAAARILRDAGFEAVVVVEPNPAVVAMARRHFRDVNGGVLEHAATAVRIADARAVLMLEAWTFDLVSIDVPNIAAARAAASYSIEFYKLVRSRLSERGVLQQRLPLAQVSPLDVVSVLATVQEVFASVRVYVIAEEATIVACVHDCAPAAEPNVLVGAGSALAPVLAASGGPAPPRAAELIDPDATRRLLEAFADSRNVDVAALVSTDGNGFLEYHTPRGDLWPKDASLHENLEFLRRFAAAGNARFTRGLPGVVLLAALAAAAQEPPRGTAATPVPALTATPRPRLVLHTGGGGQRLFPTAAAGGDRRPNRPPAGSGVRLFPPPGTNPPRAGIVVPDGFPLPPGYLRHHQTTDDGRSLPPILLFHPDYDVVDEHGNPIEVPPDRIVPPALAPPGLAVEILQVPTVAYPTPVGAKRAPGGGP